MAIELEQVLPKDIERRSFEIITEELGDTQLIPGTEPIVKRCIHTSADFDYAKNLVFSKDAVQKALDAIRQGASIVTDTQMGKSGSTKNDLQNMVEKYFALCRMKTLQYRQKRTVLRELLQVWKRQQSLIKS